MNKELNKDIEIKRKSKFDKYFTHENLIFKDPTCFKLDSIPPNFIERKENEEFYRELSIFINYRKPNNLLIKGYPGSGKTLITNVVMDTFKRLSDIQVFSVNCYGHSSSDILAILTQSKSKKSLPILMEEFLRSLEKDCIIFLDEIDRSDKINYILYGLSRPNEMLSEFNKNVSLVLVSNNFAWEESLPDKIRSSLQLKEIVFKPYTELELKNIIRQRIKLGFLDENSISDTLITQIATWIFQQRRSDCRLALDIVFYAALEAERNKQQIITETQVGKAFSIAMQDIDKRRISKLEDTQLLTLFCVCLNNIETVDDIHNRYLKVIRESHLSIKIISRIMIFHIINYLDDLGFIEKRIEVIKSDRLPRRVLKVQCKITKDLVMDEMNIRGLRLITDDEKPYS